MARDDRAYYEKRAEAELALAQRSTHACVVRAHYELATLYLDRIHEDPESASDPAGAPISSRSRLDRVDETGKRLGIGSRDLL